jgi:hypothetical protein
LAIDRLFVDKCDIRILQGLLLEELVLQGHLRVRLETNTGPEDVGQSGALLGESIDNRGARRSQRSL